MEVADQRLKWCDVKEDSLNAGKEQELQGCSVKVEASWYDQGLRHLRDAVWTQRDVRHVSDIHENPITRTQQPRIGQPVGLHLQ